MKTKFNRIADVEFTVLGEPHASPTIRISNVPFLWDAKHMASKDEQATMAALSYARSVGITQHMTPLFINTSPAKGE